MAKKTTRKTSQKRIHTNKERNCKSQSLSGIEAVLHKSAPLGNPIQEWHGRIADKNWHLYNGDAKATLRLLPKESIDCIVTSPPYYWLRDYKVNGQIGLEDSVTAYVAAIADVMEEAFRVLKPSGVMFLNLGDTYYSGKGESQGTDRKSQKDGLDCGRLTRVVASVLDYSVNRLLVYLGELPFKCVNNDGYCVHRLSGKDKSIYVNP